MTSLNRILGILVCIIVSLTAQTQPPRWDLTSQSNAISSTNSYSFKQLGWNSAISLNGYEPEATLYLPLAKRLNIQKIMLHLIINFSPKLIDGSKIDIKFNQTLINSLPSPTDSTKAINIDMELPITQLSEDWQSLNFSAFLNSNKNLCSPDLWIYVSPDSTITVTSLNKPFNGTLNELPSPFIEPSTINPISNHFLLASAPEPQEIFSLLQIAFKLGQRVNGPKVRVSSSIIGATEENLQNSNLILIGTLPHILANTASEFKDLVQVNGLDSQSAQNQGIVFLNQSPFNPFNGLLIVSGSNEEALAKATEALLTDEFNAIASGKLALVNEVKTQQKIKSSGEFYVSTLKDLGYANKSVSGLGRHSLTFNIPLPNDRMPNSSTIKTFITTPISGKSGLSQITLLVNDEKQSSFWLKKEHSEWKTAIESSSMKPGLNKLEYLIDLHFEDNSYERCSRANYDEIWATIYGQTTVTASFSNDFPLSMLNQLPVPFAGEITAILPERLTNEDINLFSRLFFKLGQIFQLTPIQMNVRSANQVNEEFIRNNNVIILGTNDTNSWVEYAFSYTPVQLKGTSRYLNLSEKQLQISGENSTGLLELTPSPWSENHAVLLVTSTNQIGLINAINALINNKLRNKLNGNIAFINADQSFETLNSFDNRYLSPRHRLMLYLSNLSKNTYYYLANHLQVFIYFFVFLIPIIIVWRNWRK